MFSNLTYRPTVYKTGISPNYFRVKLSTLVHCAFNSYSVTKQRHKSCFFQIGISHQIRLDVIWFAFPNSHIVDNTTIAQWVEIFSEWGFIFFCNCIFQDIFGIFLWRKYELVYYLHGRFQINYLQHLKLVFIFTWWVNLKNRK